jgi:hypothetical protein
VHANWGETSPSCAPYEAPANPCFNVRSNVVVMAASVVFISSGRPTSLLAAATLGVHAAEPVLAKHASASSKPGAYSQASVRPLHCSLVLIVCRSSGDLHEKRSFCSAFVVSVPSLSW